MSMVPFAMKCDRCGRRSPEYTAWPMCRHCGDDVCMDCCRNFGTQGVQVGAEVVVDGEITVADCYECVPSLRRELIGLLTPLAIIAIVWFVFWAVTL